MGPVPDSATMYGAFASEVATGRLKSPLVSVTPSQLVQIPGGSTALTMTLVLNDQGSGSSALSTETACNAAVSKLKVHG